MSINIQGIKPEPRLFHNELIDVYRKNVSITEIHFWFQNARNILDFDDLEESTGKPIDEIDELEVIKYLAKQPKLKLNNLRKSIQSNGVRVPLIIRDDGILLDGNRRYFACKLIQYSLEDNKELPKVLLQIPALIIKKEDLDADKEKKVLAEANFVPDNKVEWPIDVRAKVVWDFYDECQKDGLNDPQTLARIEDLYAIPKQEVLDFIATRKLVTQFLNKAESDKHRLTLRRVVQDKFIYFWEFTNKKGLINRTEKKNEIEELFLTMIESDRFSGFKQVEPMIRASNDNRLWQMLIDSNGADMPKVVAIYNENKAIRSVEDKIRNFFNWLEDLSQSQEATSGLSPIAKEWGKKLQASVNSFVSRF